MNKEMISIIVPCYNANKYIGRCLESLLNQTYSNIEIICIDDKSTDNSLEICEGFAAKESRIRIIRRKQNKGLSAARNLGICEAQGEYVAFVDSDDWVTPDYLETLYGLLTAYQADVAQGSYLKTAIEINGKQLRSGGEKTACMTGREAIRRMYSVAMLQPDIEYTIVCNKLYRKSVIGRIFFPEGKIYEDQYFTPMCYYKCRKIAVTDKKLYFYRKNMKGITWQKYTIKFQDEIEMHERLVEYFDKNGEDDLSATVSAREIPLAIDHYYRAEYFEDTVAQRKAYLHVLKGYRHYLRSYKVSRHNKLAVLLFLIIPPAFSVLKYDVSYRETIGDCGKNR